MRLCEVRDNNGIHCINGREITHLEISTTSDIPTINLLYKNGQSKELIYDNRRELDAAYKDICAALNALD